MRIFLHVLSQLDLKYAYALDILIHQFVHVEFFDCTLPILLNFWKTIWSQKTWMKLIKLIEKIVFQKFRKIGKVPSENSMWDKLVNQNV